MMGIIKTVGVGPHSPSGSFEDSSTRWACCTLNIQSTVVVTVGGLPSAPLPLSLSGCVLVQGGLRLDESRFLSLSGLQSLELL